ncbi:MAG: GntR family transcriptional regulator [Verrucomicrobiota bacterium]
MHPFRQLSLIEQIADHLRLGFRNGHWCGQLPGVRELVRELGVSKTTVEAALRLLEAEGSVESSGPARRKQIVAQRGAQGKGRVLRVGVVLSEPLDHINLISQQLMLEVFRRIENEGHICFTAERSVSELGDKLPRVTKMLESAKVDAWVAYSAPRELLEWFGGRIIPVMAIGGRFTGLPVAGSASVTEEATFSCVRALSALSHRRSVVISPDTWRIPSPSASARWFLTAMEECGLQPTSFNLPAWEANATGLERLLESLFRLTPPTALICVEPPVFVAAYGFFGAQGTSGSAGRFRRQSDLRSDIFAGSEEPGAFQVAAGRARPPRHPVGEMSRKGRHGPGSGDVFHHL